MAQHSELTSSSRSVNNSDIVARPFRLTVEIPMFLIMFALSLSSVAISNILLYRTCVHSLSHTVEECRVFLAPEKTNHSKSLEEEVQKYTTTISTVRAAIEAVVPAILSLFLGVWSNTHGRKPLIVWPLLGFTFTSMMIVVYAMLENYGPWWYILVTIPTSLTGGYTIFFTGVFCYLADVTTPKSRSIRMVLVEVAVSVGSVTGSLSSFYLLERTGNTYTLLIASAILVIAYAFTDIYITESLVGAIKGGISSVLDFLLVKEMINECFKERPNRLRSQIILLTIANSLSIFILYGLFGIEYMYTREKLQWSLKEYNTFSAVSISISFTGGLLALTVLQKLLNVGDLIIANFSFITYTAELIIKALAIKTWHMYLGAGIAFMKGLSAPLIRSLLSKILPVEDIAKVFALMCAIEALCPLVAPAMYNTIYRYSLSVFPGTVYILSAVITGICIVCLGFVQYYRWATNRTRRDSDSTAVLTQDVQ